MHWIRGCGMSGEPLMPSFVPLNPYMRSGLVHHGGKLVGIYKYFN